MRAGPRAVAALAAAVALGSCGGDEERSAGDLRWEGEPRVFRHPNLPRDRVLTGEVRNDSLRAVELPAARMRLVDEEGRRLPAQGVFLRTFVHGLYPPTRPPKGGLPRSERLRIGLLARIEPGESAPFTIAWRARQGRRPPVRLDYGSGSLVLPRD